MEKGRWLHQLHPCSVNHFCVTVKERQQELRDPNLLHSVFGYFDYPSTEFHPLEVDIEISTVPLFIRSKSGDIRPRCCELRFSSK